MFEVVCVVMALLSIAFLCAVLGSPKEDEASKFFKELQEDLLPVVKGEEVDPKKGVYLCGKNRPYDCLRHGSLVKGDKGTAKTKTQILTKIGIGHHMKNPRGAPTQLLEISSKRSELGNWLNMTSADVPIDQLAFDDERSVGLSFADVKRPREIAQLAADLIPITNEVQSYFPLQGRHLWKVGAMNLWTRNIPTLRHLVLMGIDHEVLDKVLQLSAEGVSLAKQFTNPEHNGDAHSQSVLAGLSQAFSEMTVAAACNERTTRKLTVTEMTDPTKHRVTILVYDPENPEVSRPILAYVMKRALRIVNRQMDKKRHFPIFVDEFGVVAKYVGAEFPDLAQMGREGGASLHLGVQSGNTLIKHLGKEIAELLLDMQGYKTYFRTATLTDRDHLSKTLGELSGAVKDFGENDQERSKRHGERKAVTDKALRDMESGGYGRDVTAYCVTRDEKPYKTTYSIDAAIGLDQVAEAFYPRRKERPVEHEYLEPWGPADDEHFGL